MINQSLDNNDKQEYQTPVLFEYGDFALITQNDPATTGPEAVTGYSDVT